MPTSNPKREKEIYDFAKKTSYQAAADHFGMKKESIKR
jgi:hypothetical protein